MKNSWKWLAGVAILVGAFSSRAQASGVEYSVTFEGSKQGRFIPPPTTSAALLPTMGDGSVRTISSTPGSVVNSFAFSVENPTTVNGGAGKAVFKDMILEMNVGTLSNYLFMVCVTGDSFDKVTLTFRGPVSSRLPSNSAVTPISDGTSNTIQVGGGGAGGAAQGGTGSSASAGGSGAAGSGSSGGAAPGGSGAGGGASGAAANNSGGSAAAGGSASSGAAATGTTKATALTTSPSTPETIGTQYTMEMKTVFVKSIEYAGTTGDDASRVRIGLSFGSITMTVPGALGPGSTASWNQVTNKQ